MTERDDLTAKQKDYAVFLPAISGFYATFIGKQRDPANSPYVDPARFPPGMTDMEQLNWLNAKKGIFPYRYSLYSGGHANLDLAKQDWSEDMVRNRIDSDPDTVILGDSGGFQIAKGKWEGDWRAGSGCAKAQKYRESSLRWLDNISNYAMTLDIPTWVIHDREANSKVGNFQSGQELVDATKYNNDFFMANRRGINNGGTRILNVLQGDNHRAADDWYDTMKHYSDPGRYPTTHFNGWAMGGQNMADMELILRRLVTLRYDGLLQQGVHDWMHFLGISKLEWSCLLTDIQRAIRRHVNANFTISYDCASPFLATANGQVYYESIFEHDGRFSYRMAPSADDKKYSTDTRPWATGVIADGIYERWEDSPVSQMLRMRDICIYRPGDLNKVGKEGNTSWDSFSYALLMAHNVWTHIRATQEANRRYDSGVIPEMLRNQISGDTFRDIVERIFSAPTRDDSLAIIDHYHSYWMEIIGVRGFKGKKAKNANTKFNELFTIS